MPQKEYNNVLTLKKWRSISHLKKLKQLFYRSLLTYKRMQKTEQNQENNV